MDSDRVFNERKRQRGREKSRQRVAKRKDEKEERKLIKTDLIDINNNNHERAKQMVKKITSN